MKISTITRNRLSIFCMTALMAAVMSLGSTHAQTVLFTENFTNLTGGNTSTTVNTLAGWNAYISQKAFNMSTAWQYNYNNDAPTPGAGVEQASSFSPTGATNTAGYLGGYLATGIGNASGALGAPKFASVYTGLSINPTSYTSLSFSWKENKSAGNAQTYLMLQVGGNWYSSVAVFAPTTGVNSALDGVTAFSLAYSPSSTAWNDFVLLPGTATGTYGAGNGDMHVASQASADLSGLITGIGFYTVDDGGVQSTVRYDQLNITGVVPEPSSVALAALAMSMLFLLRRRKALAA